MDVHFCENGGADLLALLVAAATSGALVSELSVTPVSCCFTVMTGIGFAVLVLVVRYGMFRFADYESQSYLGLNRLCTCFSSSSLGRARYHDAPDASFSGSAQEQWEPEQREQEFAGVAGPGIGVTFLQSPLMSAQLGLSGK